MEIISSLKWLSEFTSDDKVLLINPPVLEVRYAWIKWNQPSDLLLLSSKLKKEIECDVRLLDFMLPNENGRVSMRDLAKAKVIRQPGKQPFEYRARTYGMALDEVKKNLESISNEWKPDHIVVTTLTSYWFETLIQLVPYLRTLLPGIKISLIGAYPVLETVHAVRTRVDYIVNDFIDYGDYLPDFKLYFDSQVTLPLHGGKKLAFGGLKFTKTNTAKNLLSQVNSLKEYGIRDFVILEGNLFIDDCIVLTDFLNMLERENVKINLHGLCGLEISQAQDGIYTKMFKGGFRSFFLEYDLDQYGRSLNLDSYQRAYLELKSASGIRVPSGNLAGFVMIGKESDDFYNLFTHCFNILELCGSVIPKPYTPDPFVEKEIYQRVANKGLDHLSPHVFPLSEDNGISREEYVEFYKHTTFLNEKRMGNSFDFFDDSYSSEALKTSLGKKGGTFR